MFAVPPALGQECSWGGVSAVDPPTVTYLGSESDLLRAPGRLAVDGSGNIYMTDPTTGRVIVKDSNGQLLSVKEGLLSPVAIAVDGFGSIFVAEEETGSVSVFDENWRLRYHLGRGDQEFLLPNDIAIDPDPRSGWIYVSDGLAHEIKVYSLSGGFLFSFGGQGTSPGQLDFPSAVHVRLRDLDQGPLPTVDVFVADQNNDRVQVFDRHGTFLWCFGEDGSGIRRFGRLSGLTSDSIGRLYVADAFQGRVGVFDRHGVFLESIGSFGEVPAELRTPMGLALDPQSRLYVGSVNTGRVEVFGLDGSTQSFPDGTLSGRELGGADKTRVTSGRATSAGMRQRGRE